MKKQNEASSVHQQLMNEAYAFWNGLGKGMDPRVFFDGLGKYHKLAVALGNWNYQVCNGGHGQWQDNGYSSYQKPYLMSLLEEVVAKAYPSLFRALKITEACNLKDRRSMNAADTAFYKLPHLEREMELYIQDTIDYDIHNLGGR